MKQEVVNTLVVKPQRYLKLKAFFVENNIKLDDVASVLSVSRTTLSKKLNRFQGTDFKLDEVRKLCETYKINANEFFLR